MRLTLRTLLAYLDDTLDKAQARQIGQKVAESDVAREMIDRIKRVTRKRALTVPPTTGPDKADINTVAEYLDNDLPADKVNEVEEHALKSEVLLAEIAACHQLLTLILTEPAAVPPTARQRMYGLVKGPEVDPGRQVPRVAPATLAPGESESGDAESHPMLSRKGGRKRLALAGVLALLLAIPVWQSQRPGPPGDHLPARLNKAAAEPVVVVHEPAKDQAKDKQAEQVKFPEPPPIPNANDKEKDKAAVPVPAVDDAAERKPSDQRRDIGQLTKPDGVLLRIENNEWRRVANTEPIMATDRFMSLPGLNNEIRVNGAVSLELWAVAPERDLPPPIGTMYESVAVPLVPAKGLDADVWLERGRIYLRALKSSGAKVRLRLGDDVFDLSLPDEKCEALAELTSGFSGAAFDKDPKRANPPTKFATVGMIRGTAALKVNALAAVELKPAPNGLAWTWDSVRGPADRPNDIAEPLSHWSRLPRTAPVAQEMAAVVKRSSKDLMNDKQPLKLAIQEIAFNGSAMNLGKWLCAYDRVAIDDIEPLLGEVEDESNSDTRIAAVAALYHWIGRAAGNDAILYADLIAKRGVPPAKAEAALQLWHGFDSEGPKNSRTYSFLIEQLNDDRLIVRELARWWLNQFAPDEAKGIQFRTMDPLPARLSAIQAWKRAIPDGKLPPSRPR